MKPIAIIGIGCRFPKANNPHEFWQLLSNGIDGITEIPKERWNINEYYDEHPETQGKMNSRHGGFLSQVDGFDPNFFGISPREALLMDPQQRLLLEVAWETIEDAGITREQLAGSKTGVFVGIATNDYSRIHAGYSHHPQGYDLTGNCTNIAAGRLSYLFNLKGPSLAVDTACSSSLVAVHLACQSLWNDESSMAIAAGVNLILSPIGNIALSKLKALSPDGRCKTFDESANGYVRSEGVGCIILKPLAQAIADKDSIYALIRGTAINHDGRSKGLTVPYGPAQESLIRSALKNAEIEPKELNYVELHGTGTSLGDPIEAMALGAVLEEGRDKDNLCLVGSVKSNIGHLEAAAGIASVIKMALSLKNKQIPPSLHFNKPNPYIPFDKLPLKLQSSLITWPQQETSAKVGISSFGFSGTNAHLILEEANLSHQEPISLTFPHLLPLSAHSHEAVKDLAQNYEDFLKDQALTAEFVQNLCYSSSARRTHHAHRQAVVVHSPEELLRGLKELETIDLSTQSKPSKRKTNIAFVFSGQGPQWWAMGRELLATEPVFRSVIKQCDTLIQKYANWSLLAEFNASEAQSRLQETEVSQPALFALQVGLAKLWQSWGINPKSVVGHSLGEVAAAHFAGILTLEEAIHLICQRGQLMQQATGNGKMLAIELPVNEVENLMAAWENKLEIAAINSPYSTVVSGESQSIDQLIAELSQNHPHIFYKELPVNYAFHSQQMTTFADNLVKKLGELQPQKSTIPIFSTVTGDQQEGTLFNAAYWGQNMRQTVRFNPAIEAMIKSRHTIFVEISPHPVLLGYIKSTLREQDTEGFVLPSLRREHSERGTLLNSLGKLYTWGQSINWEKLYPENCQFVKLPLYPWQHESYWVSDAKPQFKSVSSASSLLNLLVEGKTEQLTEQLNQSVQLSPEVKQFLPQLLQLLVGEDTTIAGQMPILQDVSKNCYQVEWQLSPLNLKNKPSQGDRWLIFNDNQGVGKALATTLNDAYILVSSGQTYQKLVSGHYQINPNNDKDFQRLLQDLTEPITKVVYLWGLDSDINSQPSQTRSYASLLYLTQALAQFKTKEPPKLWVITQQAQPVNDAVKPLKIAQTSLWGMGQVIALEYPNLWGGLIDLEEKQPSSQAIIAEITENLGEDRIAFRDHQRYVARLVPNKAIKSSNINFKKTEASYLITGGLGSLGLSLADWLIEKGANHLILTSRRALADHSTDKQVKIKALEDKGATIQVIAADVSDHQQTRQLFHQIQENCPPLQGIIHAAGVLSDRTIDKMDFHCFESVFNPKAAGAWNLHQLSQDLSLDFFVCFSSMSALIGSRGQIHYAAANHFLDGLMHYRRESGLTGLSINWGPWAKGGMATQGYEEGLKRLGINPLQPNLALDTLDALINGNVTQTMVAEIDWSKFKTIVAAKGRVAFLEALFKQDQDNFVQTVENFPKTIQKTPPHRRVTLLTTRLQQEVAQVLGIHGDTLPDTDKGFFEMGMDSLMSVELKHRLEGLFSVSLPSTFAFEYPTIGDVVQYFVQEVFAWEDNSENSQISSETESTDVVVLNQALAELESLSEAETEALMEQELAELEALL